MHRRLMLQNLFREVFDDESLVLAPETSRADIEGWDSVAQVQLVLAIEEAFGIQFTETEVSGISAFGEFLDAIQKRGSLAA